MPGGGGRHADQVIERDQATRRLVDLKAPCGAPFIPPQIVKKYLGTELAELEHEVFVVLFLDSQHLLIR